MTANNGSRQNGHIPQCLKNLHMGAGIQRADLYERLDPEVRRRAGITSDDDLKQVRDKLTRLIHWHIEREFRAPNVRLALMTALNTGAPGTGQGDRLGTRWRHLESLHGDGFSVRTAQRLWAEHYITLYQQVMGGTPPPDDRDCAIEVQTEPAEGCTPPDAPRGSLLTMLIRDMGQHDLETITKVLLKEYLLVATASNGHLNVSHTASMGSWICAFTDLGLLERFQQAVQPSWAGHKSMVPVRGIDLIRRINDSPTPLGLAIDPQPGSGGSLSQTFALESHEVERIAMQS